MATTINISLPEGMYKDAKKVVAKQKYASISELIRDALRKILYPIYTENGLTPEFEELVLEASKEPIDYSKAWETDKDTENYFKHFKLPDKKAV